MLIWLLKILTNPKLIKYSANKERKRVMDRLKELIEYMMDQMRADLKRSGDYDSYGEEGIRIAVYEDLKDSLKHQFSDILYK